MEAEIEQKKIEAAQTQRKLDAKAAMEREKREAEMAAEERKREAEKAEEEADRDMEIAKKKMQAEQEYNRLEMELMIEREKCETQIQLKKIEMDEERMRIEAEAAQKEIDAGVQRARIEAGQDGDSRRTSTSGNGVSTKVPRLPVFHDNKDDLDAYIERFERFATTHHWPRESWASSLSALITSKALEVYSRLSADEVDDFDVLKKALLDRYEECRRISDEAKRQYC